MAVLNMTPEFQQVPLPSPQPLALLLQGMMGGSTRGSQRSTSRGGDTDDVLGKGTFLMRQGLELAQERRALDAEYDMLRHKVVSDAQNQNTMQAAEYITRGPGARELNMFLSAKYYPGLDELKVWESYAKKNREYYDAVEKRLQAGEISPDAMMYNLAGEPIMDIKTWRQTAHMLPSGEMLTPFVEPDFKGFQDAFDAAFKGLGETDFDSFTESESLGTAEKTVGEDRFIKSTKVKTFMKGAPYVTNREQLDNAYADFMKTVSADPKLSQVYNVYKNNYLLGGELANESKKPEERKEYTEGSFAGYLRDIMTGGKQDVYQLHNVTSSYRTLSKTEKADVSFPDLIRDWHTIAEASDSSRFIIYKDDIGKNESVYGLAESSYDVFKKDALLGAYLQLNTYSAIPLGLLRDVNIPLRNSLKEGPLFTLEPELVPYVFDGTTGQQLSVIEAFSLSSGEKAPVLRIVGNTISEFLDPVKSRATVMAELGEDRIKVTDGILTKESHDAIRVAWQMMRDRGIPEFKIREAFITRGLKANIILNADDTRGVVQNSQYDKYLNQAYQEVSNPNIRDMVIFEKGAAKEKKGEGRYKGGVISPRYVTDKKDEVELNKYFNDPSYLSEIEVYIPVESFAFHTKISWTDDVIKSLVAVENERLRNMKQQEAQVMKGSDITYLKQ